MRFAECCTNHKERCYCNEAEADRGTLVAQRDASADQTYTDASERAAPWPIRYCSSKLSKSPSRLPPPPDAPLLVRSRLAHSFRCQREESTDRLQRCGGFREWNPKRTVARVAERKRAEACEPEEPHRASLPVLRLPRPNSVKSSSACRHLPRPLAPYRRRRREVCSPSTAVEISEIKKLAGQSESVVGGSE